jgi:hypothetical protein
LVSGSMSKEHDKKESQKDSFSDSNELFESIFRQAISETEKPKSRKTNVEENRRAIAVPSKAQSQSKRKVPPVVNKLARQVNTAPPKSAKVKPNAAIIENRTPSRPKTRSRERPSRIKMTMLVILVVLLGGILVRYLGVLDLSFLSGFIGLEEKKIAQGPQKTIARTRPEKKVIPRPKKQAEHFPLANKNEVGALASGETVQAPPTEPKKVETSGSDQLENEIGRSEIGAPSAETHPLEETFGEEKASSPRRQPESVEDLDKGVTRPMTVSVQPPPAKATAKGIPYPQLIQEHYHFSIYLGSYKTSKQVEKACSSFMDGGFSPYWARVDLGAKGVWFRLFAGYFHSKEAAESYIRKKQIAGAEPGYTKYANFLGSYRSEEDLEAQKAKLLSLGFCPYTVKGSDGRTLLYSGAFDREKFANKNQRDLASKGFQNEVVER